MQSVHTGLALENFSLGLWTSGRLGCVVKLKHHHVFPIICIPVDVVYGIKSPARPTKNASRAGWGALPSTAG